MKLGRTFLNAWSRVERRPDDKLPCIRRRGRPHFAEHGFLLQAITTTARIYQHETKVGGHTRIIRAGWRGWLTASQKTLASY
jgi:hypothetical protein